MDDELALVLNILRTRITENKFAAVSAIIEAELQGSNLVKQDVKLLDARKHLASEISRIADQREKESWAS